MGQLLQLLLSDTGYGQFAFHTEDEKSYLYNWVISLVGGLHDTQSLSEHCQVQWPWVGRKAWHMLKCIGFKHAISSCRVPDCTSAQVEALQPCRAADRVQQQHLICMLLC